MPTPEQIAAVVRLASQGKTLRAIAAEVGGISHSHVGRILAQVRGIAATAGTEIPSLNTPQRETLAPRPARPVAPAPPPKKKAKPAAPPAPSESVPEAPAPAGEDPPEALVEILRRQLVKAERDAAEQSALGNTKSAAQYARMIAVFAPVIARLEDRLSEDRDVIKISRAELASAEARYRERVRALLDRPLLCAQCGRALSADWGEGRK